MLDIFKQVRVFIDFFQKGMSYNSTCLTGHRIAFKKNTIKHIPGLKNTNKKHLEVDLDGC